MTIDGLKWLRLRQSSRRKARACRGHFKVFGWVQLRVLRPNLSHSSGVTKPRLGRSRQKRHGNPLRLRRLSEVQTSTVVQQEAHRRNRHAARHTPGIAALQPVDAPRTLQIYADLIGSRRDTNDTLLATSATYLLADKCFSRRSDCFQRVDSKYLQLPDRPANQLSGKQVIDVTRRLDRRHEANYAALHRPG